VVDFYRIVASSQARFMDCCITAGGDLITAGMNQTQRLRLTDFGSSPSRTSTALPRCSMNPRR
jgi:hypothetical protein